MALSINNVIASYGNIEVLHGISIDIPDGAYVAVVGANGAGKTTLLKTISGMTKVTGGDITFNNSTIIKTPAHKIPNYGIAHVPEGRQVFPQLSVIDNLIMGSWLTESKKQRKHSLDMVYDLFPRLKERAGQMAGTLSGGEQQMVAVGRALMLQPTLLMLDEPSQGLAPKLVNEMYDKLSQVHGLGMSILLVEQNVTSALKYSETAYVLEEGRIALSGTSDELLNKDEIRRAYLGI